MKEICVHIKCFQTEQMPDNVYDEIVDVLNCGDDGDTAKFWVSQEGLSDFAFQWFRDNGARNGECVVLERGTWPGDQP